MIITGPTYSGREHFPELLFNEAAVRWEVNQDFFVWNAADSSISVLQGAVATLMNPSPNSLLSPSASHRPGSAKKLWIQLELMTWHLFFSLLNWYAPHTQKESSYICSARVGEAMHSLAHSSEVSRCKTNPCGAFVLSSSTCLSNQILIFLVSP